MNINDRENFGRDEPNFQDEYLDYDRNAALDDGPINDENINLNRQFNSIDNQNDEDDFGTIDEESRDDEEDFDAVSDDDLEEDGDLDDDDLDDDFDDDDDEDLDENDRQGDLYKDVDLSLQDEINQDQEEVDPINHQRNY